MELSSVLAEINTAIYDYQVDRLSGESLVSTFRSIKSRIRNAELDRDEVDEVGFTMDLFIIQAGLELI